MSTHGKWDIQPDGVSSVVTKTGQVAKGLEREATSYSGHLENAAKYAGTLSQGGETGSGTGTGLVAVALSQFAEATSKSLSYVADQTGKSLQGAVDATKAYLHGDLDMAAEAQANAGKDASPPPYSPPPRGAK